MAGAAMAVAAGALPLWVLRVALVRSSHALDPTLTALLAAAHNAICDADS